MGIDTYSSNNKTKAQAHSQKINFEGIEEKQSLIYYITI